ncbi:MAG: hypothetical protein AAF570_02125, partial [Bacteroidota bacterium]
MHFRLVFLLQLILLTATILPAQSSDELPLPPEIADIPEAITLQHAPTIVPQTRSIERGQAVYSWRHNTSLQSAAPLQILEGGAFLRQGEQWVRRVQFSAKEIARLFECPNGKMAAGERYTFEKNWRHDTRLYGGDALWYVIAETADGKRVRGTGIVQTVVSRTGTYQLDEKSSLCQWEGYAVGSNYALSGTVQARAGQLEVRGDALTKATVTMEMKTIDSELKDLVRHLKNVDF